MKVMKPLYQLHISIKLLFALLTATGLLANKMIFH